MDKLSVDHLLGIKSLNKSDINLIFKTASHFKEVINRPIKKVPTLRDITIANLYFISSEFSNGETILFCNDLILNNTQINETYSIKISQVLSINESSLPHDFYLGTNFPNPFNSRTKINFSLEKYIQAFFDGIANSIFEYKELNAEAKRRIKLEEAEKQEQEKLKIHKQKIFFSQKRL